MKTAKLKDLKQKVLENLKTKGYHEYQLKELNPIIQATKQALNIPVISSTEELWNKYNTIFPNEG